MAKSTEKLGNTSTTFFKTNPTFNKTSMTELKSNNTKTIFKGP